MRKVYAILLAASFVLAFLAPCFAAAPDDGAWDLVMDKNGIKAYSRRVEGSGIFEFRAVAVINAPVEVVSEALRDVPATPEWLPYCDESHVVDMKDRNHFTTYISMDIPWPVTDRDLVLETNTEYDLDHGRAITNFHNVCAASCPPKPDHIRIPALTGQYVFEYITRERTGIVHTYRADLGGSIPEWMANFATKYNMYKTFTNLMEHFEKPKYKELAKTSPDREVCENILENKERVKEILVARLREFIKDGAFIDMIAQDKNIDAVLLSDNGRTSETLLYGWGSDDSKKDAVRGILHAYLAGCTQNAKLIKKVLDDDALAQTILHGPAPQNPASRQIIKDYLAQGKVVASK